MQDDLDDCNPYIVNMECSFLNSPRGSRNHVFPRHLRQNVSGELMHTIAEVAEYEAIAIYDVRALMGG